MLTRVNNAPGAPVPIGPYSQAMKAGNLVFCAGQIGLDPSTKQMVLGGISEQVRQVLSNLQAVLQAAGSSPEKILMTTVFLTDSNQGPVVNELYSQFINPEAPPARQTVVVKELPLGALVEISVIALCS